MSTVADFFKSTVTDNLAKLVQPSGLVPAALLVFLNLALLYPPALTEERPIAVQYGGLSEGWQALTIAALIFALGVFFFTIAGTSVDLLTGQSWRSSRLGRAGIWLERNRIERLWRTAALHRNERALARQLTTQYPVIVTVNGVDGTKDLEPTRLGNALSANQRQIDRRYGIDVAVLGRHLQETKDLKDAPALASLRDERTALDLLANLVLSSLILWAELVAFNAWREDWATVVLAYVLLPAAYLLYRLALVKALGWAAALAVLVDLHRAELRKALGLRERADSADERALWEAASTFYLAGQNAKPGDLFEKAAVTAVRVFAAPNVETTTIEAAPDNKPETQGTSSVVRQLRYRFLVAGKAGSTVKGPLVIDDPRIDRLPSTVEAESHLEGRAVFMREGHQGLRFELGATTSHRALDIHYSVPLARIRNCWECDVAEDTAGTYLIRGHGGTIDLELAWTPPALPFVRDGGRQVFATPQPPWGVSFVGLSAAEVYLVFPDLRS